MSESNVAQDQIKAYVERILRMKEEAKAINADIREIYAEAKGNGFDKTVLGKLVTYIEKRQTDASAMLESESLFDLYLTAYDSAAGNVGTKNANAHTHEKNWQAPRIASLGDQKDAYRAGQPISQDFQYENASVYFFAFYEIGRVKIGVSNDVAARLQDLSMEQGCEGEILHVMPGNRQAEMAAHKRFEAFRVEGEWFRDCAEVRAMIGEYKVSALRADPAMAIVDPSKINKPEPQPPQPAGSDLAVNPESTGQVATNSEPAREGGSQSQEAAGPGRDAAAPSSGEAQPKYAAPGVVVWETHPPEGVERGVISAAFGTLGQDAAVIADDLEKGRVQPIVKRGKVILDGWARFMAARGMRELDGSPVAYPVVQYAGSDLLTDIIKLNVEGRILTEQQKRLIAANLSRQQPDRKEDIYRAFELFLEPV